jgi:hypothetical protein
MRALGVMMRGASTRRGDSRRDAYAHECLHTNAYARQYAYLRMRACARLSLLVRARVPHTL